MLTIGIIITILLGFLAVNVISVRFGILEKIGLSFPLGMAIQTFLIVFLDIVNIPFSPASFLGIEAIAALAFGYIVFRKRSEYVSYVKSTQIEKNPLRLYNLVWLLFIGLIIYVEYMNFSKCMFFPPFDRDALGGFEALGYAAAHEGTYKGLSLFNSEYVLNIQGPGSYITYMPLVQLSYTYVYVLGAETSKIIPALMFAFFLLSFYAVSSRKIGKTAAAIATFFVLITPEMIAFSSLSMTNVIHAIFASLGVIYIALWLQQSREDQKKNRRDLWIGALLIGFNGFIRTEGIVFIGAVCIALAINALRYKEYKSLILPIIICFFPIVFWTVFLKIYNLTAESIAITHLFWDAQKFETIKDYAIFLFKHTQYYGYVFVFFLISLISNLWFIIKKKDNLYLLLMLFLSVIFYYTVLYQIDYRWDSVEAVLITSAKRFMFCYIPIFWFASFSNKTFMFLTEKLEKLLKI